MCAESHDGDWSKSEETHFGAGLEISPDRHDIWEALAKSKHDLCRRKKQKEGSKEKFAFEVL